MDRKTLLSIVVPVYKVKAYLYKCPALIFDELVDVGLIYEVIAIG